MEVKKEVRREYNPAHPNYKRWQKARELSNERAKFVESVLSNVLNVEGLRILDVGAGEGNTSMFLSKKNFVVSLEPKSERIKKISRIDSLHPVMANSLGLPFKPANFNLIILQDVIEHLVIDKKFVNGLASLLKENGVIYISTPNRYSLFNIISDPHWGMPFLSLFDRDQIKKYFLKTFRNSDYSRNDIAELLSLKDLFELFSKDFSIKICTKFSIDYLLNGGKGLVWSNFHIQIVKTIKILGLKNILIRIANDKPGIINRFFNPTFYIILKKK